MTSQEIFYLSLAWLMAIALIYYAWKVMKLFQERK
jgi:flagellar biogenesis protein FliO